MKIGRMILGAIVALSCIISTVGCSGAVSSVGNIEPMTFVDGDKIAEINIEGYGTIRAKLFPDLAPKGVENFIMLAEQGYYDGLKIHRVMKDNFIQGGSLNGDGTGGKALINNEGVFDIETSEKARHLYGALSYVNDNGDNSAQFFIVTNKTSQDLNTFDVEQIKAAATANTELKEIAPEDSYDHKMFAYKESYYNRLAEMIGSATDDCKKKYQEAGGIPLFDGGFTVFGQVYEGFDILDKLAGVEVENNAYSEKSRPVEDIVISSVTIVTYKTPGTGEAEEESSATESKNDKESDTDSSSAESDNASTESSADSTSTESGADSTSTEDSSSTADENSTTAEDTSASEAA